MGKLTASNSVFQDISLKNFVMRQARGTGFNNKEQSQIYLFGHIWFVALGLYLNELNLELINLSEKFHLHPKHSKINKCAIKRLQLIRSNSHQSIKHKFSLKFSQEGIV